MRGDAARRLAILLFAQAAALTGDARAGEIALQAGGQRLTAELALTEAQQRHGLMGRAWLPANHGMLFVYARPGYRCMWMKDTPIRLSVAFLDDAGTIINLADMQALSLDRHCASRPARFALEMTAGWFDRHGLRPGMRVEGLEATAQAFAGAP